MVDLSPIALPTRLLTGCCKIHVSMPSRFWRGNASIWPASLSSSSAASQHAFVPEHVRYIDLRRRWSHGYWYVLSAGMGSCRNRHWILRSFAQCPGKRFSTPPLDSLREAEEDPLERVGARHQRRRTRLSSGFGCSGPFAQLRAATAIQGVHFDEFVKQWRALEGQSRVFVDHAGEILVWSRSVAKCSHPVVRRSEQPGCDGPTLHSIARFSS